MKNPILSLPKIADERGALSFVQNGMPIKFETKRVYWIYETQANVRRGLHAHKNLRQILVCISGSCSVLLDDGYSQQTYQLDRPDVGLLIEGLIWREMFNFSSDCVLLAMADAEYSENDYIRSYSEFSTAVLHAKTIKK